MKAIVHANLLSLGWHWSDAGIVLELDTPSGRVQVMVPLQTVWALFARHFPGGGGVGCAQSVGGFWGSITRSVRKVTRGVKRVARRVVPKRIQRAANAVYRHAHRALRTVRTAVQSDVAMYTIMGLALVPGMAPASAGLLAAQQALRRVDAGVRAAEKLLQGAQATPQLVRAMRRGQGAKRLIAGVVGNARSGKPFAQNFLQGLQRVAATG
jgi:hypothetical protein